MATKSIRYNPDIAWGSGDESEFPNLDEITKDARNNLIGQTGASSSTLPNLVPSLGIDLGTKAAQGLLGWYLWKKEREAAAKARRIQQEQFDRQMGLQERGQDFRESSYRAESPLRTAQAASGLNNVAGQNLKYLDLVRGLRGVGV